MFKVFFIVSLLLFVSVAHARNFVCRGKVSNGGSSVMVQANWVSLTQLVNVNVVTSAPAKYSVKSVTADQNYKPRAPIYQGYNRFEIGSDGWSTTYLLLPAAAPGTAEFIGYYMDTGHSGEGSARLLCQ